MKFLFLPILLLSGALCAEEPVEIPANLDGAHAALMKIFPAETLEAIRTGTLEEMINYHHGAGTWIRNNWGLWKGSTLSRYLNGLGLQHPDDMSAVIFDSFWYKLHNREFPMQERVAFYREYWESQREPEGKSPADGAKIEWVASHGSGKGTVHLGISTSDRSQWRYEYGSPAGIQPANEEDKKYFATLFRESKEAGTKSEDVIPVPGPKTEPGKPLNANSVQITYEDGIPVKATGFPPGTEISDPKTKQTWTVQPDTTLKTQPAGK